MKKLLLSALVLCMALFVSCSKDSDSASNSGGGSTLKRLHETYQKEDYLRLTWNNETQTWDTTENHVGHFSLTQTFNWNGDKLVSVGNNYINLEYNNDGLVSKVVRESANGEADTAYFYYNGDNQIIKMDRYEYKDVEPEPFYRFTTWDITYSNGKPINASSSDGLSMQATWTGDNITELQYMLNSSVKCRETFTYDNCYNFCYGFNCMEAISMAGGKSFDGGFFRYMSFVSKNNVINYQSTYDESWSNILSDENIDYHYTYSGNYPIERVYQHHTETETYISTYTHTNKYVYLN